MENCNNCGVQNCKIIKRIEDIVSRDSFSCFNWVLKPYQVTLLNPGQRLAEYNLDMPDNTKIYTHLPLQSEPIPENLKNTSVLVIAHIDQFVRLIKLPTLNTYCYINVRGLAEK